jgi:drug/metabolite transporter (DMT)-like permease
MSPARRAEAVLFLVTVAWGLTFPMIKGALADAPPLVFLALRFPLALVLLWPLLKFRRPSRRSLGAGAILSLLVALSFFAQTLGLVYTTPTRSGFITGLGVILTPLLYPLFTRRAPGRWPMAGAVTACAGMFLLTSPEGGGLNQGDLLTLITALCYALYIIYLEVASRRHPYEDLVLHQFILMCLLFPPLALVQHGAVHWGPGLIWGLVVTGPILGMTLYLQNRFQKDTTAPRAAVIFAAEPVFAALFSYLLLGETLVPIQWGGGALILAGILVAEKR